MVCVGLVMATGWISSWSDTGYLLFGIAMGAPMLLGPAVVHRRFAPTEPRLQSHWLALNLWIAILVAFGTYFGTHYFFDLMGMRYRFPVRWTFEAKVLGRTGGEVPVFMYPLTQAYFMTYFVGLSVGWRWLRRRFDLGTIGSTAVLLGLSYAVAFGETFFMANEFIGRYFAYADRERMLGLGSIGYAIYFVIGVPMLARLETQTARQWSAGRVALEALATSMMILCGLEIWAQVVGPL